MSPISHLSPMKRREFLKTVGADIGETRNVYDQFPEVVERLDVLLESYKQRGRSTPGEARALQFTGFVAKTVSSVVKPRSSISSTALTMWAMSST